MAIDVLERGTLPAIRAYGPTFEAAAIRKLCAGGREVCHFG